MLAIAGSSVVVIVANDGVLFPGNPRPPAQHRRRSPIELRSWPRRHSRLITTRAPATSTGQHRGVPRWRWTGPRPGGYQFANEDGSDQYKPNDPKVHTPDVYPRETAAMANTGADSNGKPVLPGAYGLPQTVFGTTRPDGLATLHKIARPVSAAMLKTVRRPQA
jgi:hypothetical protein